MKTIEERREGGREEMGEKEEILRKCIVIRQEYKYSDSSRAEFM
jgi:hypothetical protein